MFVALDIQHAMRMRRIILSSLVYLALPYLSTLSHSWHHFWKTGSNIKCVFDFIFYFCLKYLSL